MSETEGGASKQDAVVVSLDWDAEGVAVVKQAAALSRVSFDAFVKKAAEAEAQHVLTSRKGLMDLNQAAEYLGVARTDVVKLISEGKLKARKINDEWLVEQASARKAYEEVSPLDLDQIELDLQDIVRKAGLTDLVTDGAAPSSLAATWCYVSQDGALHCPRAAWRRLGRDSVLSEARDAVRRYLKRKDKEAGRI